MKKKRLQRSCNSTYRSKQILDSASSSESETDSTTDACSSKLECRIVNKAAFKLTPARFHFTKAPHNTVDAGNSLVFNSSNLPDVSFSHSQGDASLHDLRDWDGIDDVVDAVRIPEVNESPVRQEPTDAEVILSGDNLTVVDVPVTAICDKPAIKSGNLESCEPAETRKSQRVRKAPVRFRGASSAVLDSEGEAESVAESSIIESGVWRDPAANESLVECPGICGATRDEWSATDAHTPVTLEEAVRPAAPDLNQQELLTLPTYVECPDQILEAKWGNLEGRALEERITNIYTETVKWRRNLFFLPTGKAGEGFIEELNRVFSLFNSGSPFEPIALTMTSIIFPLLLQKPSKNSKTKDHVRYLEKRLETFHSLNG